MRKRLLCFTAALAVVAVSVTAQRHSPQRFPNISGSDCDHMTSANGSSVPADTFRQYINDGANSMRWQLWGDIEFTDGTMSRRVTSAAVVVVRQNGVARSYRLVVKH